MAEPLDIASTVGTWFAAGLTIIALFGILTPWLLWRSLRSERHLALKSVDDNEHIFVSEGLHIWRNTYAFRTVTLPYLVEPVKLSTLNRRDARLPDLCSRTGWVALLRAYKAFSLLSKDRGGDLVFRDGETWLPMNKLWLLVFGILSRFDVRDDLGQTIATERRAPRLDYEHLGKKPEPGRRYGCTGILQRGGPTEGVNIDRIYFTPYNHQLCGDLSGDHMPLTTLFWLHAGCLPISHSIVYDLHYDSEQIEYRSTVTPGKRVPSWDDVGRTEAGKERLENLSDEHLLPGIALLRFERLSDLVTSSPWYARAAAMGCNLENLKMLQQVDQSSLNSAELEGMEETLLQHA
ncbi:hypothetical protein CC80DRAFT_596410 [Byssothecium circinans]|uniref:Uncharacterized protein n=1 Tax=Byssothecium circinans TaxID=147558 RepID=A0A6A5TLL1_9PLEO|nr:hypothetical protein CC80DRAFT_596410 [Byssothecium circinans]